MTEKNKVKLSLKTRVLLEAEFVLFRLIWPVFTLQAKLSEITLRNVKRDFQV